MLIEQICNIHPILTCGRDLKRGKIQPLLSGILGKGKGL